MARADAGMLDKDGFAERTPVGHRGRPEEGTHAATFLAQPATGFIIGATLAVDGGITIRGDPDENINAFPLPLSDAGKEANIGEDPNREHVFERGKASTVRPKMMNCI